MIRTLGLGLVALMAALAIAVGALPGPAQAQHLPARWVLQCVYGGGAGAPSYQSPTFAVGSTAEHPPKDEVEAGWRAWLRANVGLRYESDAYCSVNYEGNLAEIQRISAQRADQHRERVKWIPDFAVPYELPREIYYLCYEPQYGLQRRFVTDLYKAPMPENLDAYLKEAHHKHERWLASQDLKPYPTNAQCDVLSPEPYQLYARWLDGASVVSDPDRPFRLTRSAWPGIDPVAAPNLIDDLAARAKYAKMSIAPRPAVAKVAPPPSKPKPAGPPPKAPALTVKEDTSAKDAAKAWEEQVKKTLAAETQKRAETAAKAAQADAETKRKIAEFMAERRRQGAAQ